MKLIFSRKGFDSGAGKAPSPIFPDNSIVSLPIPDKHSKIEYQHIKAPNGANMGDLVEKITKNRISRRYKAHLDPDLYRGSLRRERGWRPVFGQTGAAQGHLKNNDIGVNDLFLFFGKFQRIISDKNQIRFDSNSKPVHFIFGWLQVGKVFDVNRQQRKMPKWISYHPHLARKMRDNNTLYIASKNLSLVDSLRNELPGAGIFKKFSSTLQLTDPNSKGCSVWKLPKWFYPEGRCSALSFHSDKSRWEKKSNSVCLRTVGRGQEFVLDCDDYPEAYRWLKKIFVANLG